MKSKFTAHIPYTSDRITHEFIQFSDGTIQLDIRPVLTSDFYRHIFYRHISYHEPDRIVIDAWVVDSSGIIALGQLKEFYCSLCNAPIVLNLRYTPYARYDRKMVDSSYDVLSLKVFTNILNSYNFDSVLIDDPHSDVTPGLINNSAVIDQLTCLASCEIPMSDYAAVVAPDIGALKKATSIAEHYSLPLVYALKKRDPATGYTVFEQMINPDGVDISGKKILIVDDICDGGATFINLAAGIHAIYPNAIIDLYVTHGIFSKGKSLAGINNVYCYNDLHALLN